jgi:hypothetical protein
MKMLRSIAVTGFFLASLLPATAQWQTQNHGVPIGKGGGGIGFSAAVPSTAGIPLTSQGPSTDPAFSPVQNAGVQPGAANTYKGSLNGTTTADIAIPGCTGVSQAIQYTTGTGPSCGTISGSTGFDMPTNMGLSASATANALTINLTTASGAVPSASSPVSALFRSTTISTGTAIQATVATSLTLTVPSGATLGTSSSNVPFRIWIFLAYNGGTPELAVATCSNSTNVFGCSAWENTLKTTTVLNSSAGTAGVPYAPTANAADAVRIIGYCDYSSGLTTAGTWASSCTGLQIFGPGIKKPGDTVQTVYALSSTAAIAPTSAINLVRVATNASNGLGTSGSVATTRITRNGSAIGPSQAAGVTVTSSSTTMPVPMSPIIDAPATVSSTTYGMTANVGTLSVLSVLLDEIMG